MKLRLGEAGAVCIHTQIGLFAMPTVVRRREDSISDRLELSEVGTT